MKYRFIYANKQQLQEILPICFKILHCNMNLIAPTGNSYEKDFDIWYSAVFPAMQKTPREIVLMYYESTVVGYFQYYIVDGSMMMEEIQITTEYHGKGLFRDFYTWFLNNLDVDIQFVEAYAHRKNVKSQSILRYLGLDICDEKGNDNHFYFKGKFIDLQNVFLN